MASCYSSRITEYSYLGLLCLASFVVVDSLCTVAVTSMILVEFGLADFLTMVNAVAAVDDRIFCLFYY